MCSNIKANIDECAIGPLNINLFIAGDMNIPSVAARFFSYSTPVPTITADTDAEQNRYGTLANKNILNARLTEIEGDVPTRYNDGNSTGSTIERILTNTTPSERNIRPCDVFYLCKSQETKPTWLGQYSY